MREGSFRRKTLIYGRLPSERRLEQRKQKKAAWAEAVARLRAGERLSPEAYVAIFKKARFSTEDIDLILHMLNNDELLDYGESIEDIHFEQEEDIVRSSSIILPNVEAELIEYFRKDPKRLYKISSREFENFVAAVFRNQGFTVELTPQTRDHGVDLIAVANSRLTGGSTYFVECKRYAPSNKVGIGIVQRLLGVVCEGNANKGILATTSFFTRDATSVAERSRHLLSLQDYDAIVGWLKGP